jgi:hypothetical protein
VCKKEIILTHSAFTLPVILFIFFSHPKTCFNALNHLSL